jgi:hypothetical protein
MGRGKFMTGWMATALLAVATVVVSSAPSLALRSNFGQGRQGVQSHPQPAEQHQEQAHPQQSGPGKGHAGDWLRKHKDQSPADRERALENDPGFRHLPQAQQQQLRQRLQHFSNLPPEQQRRMLDNMERWEHLTPTQKQQVRDVRGRMQQLPDNRRRMVTTAVRDLGAVRPGEREAIIDSKRFKSMFSPEEREIMRSASRLPFAPPEGGAAAPEQ